jgi:excisionase family DNA binding protein
MSQELYSVEQVADLLGLHVRTVRNYVRDGRLKAVRIGKQYRIAREDVEALTGREAAPSPAPSGAARARHIEVSSIVQIDAISPDEASRVTNGLLATANSRSGGGGAPLRVDALYDETRACLKLIITGDLATSAALLQLGSLYLESRQ